MTTKKDTAQSSDEFPHTYQKQRQLEREARKNREKLLDNPQITIPPICGYTYKPRKPKRPPTNWTGDPVVCMRVAGTGTNHHGNGWCDYHEVQSNKDGNRQRLNASIKQARDLAYANAKFFGAAKPTDPHTALMDEIARTASIIAWVEDKLLELKEDGEHDEQILQQYNVKFGFQPSVWYTMLSEERQHLVRTCTAAIKAGVAERKVQIAEQQGRIIVSMMMAFIHDKELGLNPEQIMKAPALVRKHLLSLPQAEASHPAHQILEAEVVGQG